VPSVILPSHDEEYIDIVEMLLIHGANVNAKNNKGVTPLHIAVLLGAVKIAEMLIKYGAYMNARDDEGNTPLHYVTHIAHVHANYHSIMWLICLVPMWLSYYLKMVLIQR